jgi:leucine dehydrogenase
VRTVAACAIDEPHEHETLLVRRGRRSGAAVVIAVHSTALGPALGGCRLWSYATLQAAVADAMRLSRAMTLKAAVAGLPLGGGKAVICPPVGAEVPRGAFREALLHDFAEAIELLDGSYITAEDVGTTTADMARLRRWTEHVVGRPVEHGGGGDPGAVTAAGVEAALHACFEHVFGGRSLARRSVAIVGVGSVGGALARRLARRGTRLVLADIDPAKRALARALGANWMAPQDALRARVDAVAPCALGAVIDAQLVRELRCRIICGAANNQLASDELAARLAAEEILYAPDFVVNAAGLINVSLELTGYDAEHAQRRAAAIETVLSGVLARAQKAGETPLRAATDLARERLRSCGPLSARTRYSPSRAARSKPQAGGARVSLV